MTKTSIGFSILLETIGNLMIIECWYC